MGRSSGLRAPGVVARARLLGIVLGFKLADEFCGVHGGGDEERPAQERAFFNLVNGQARAKVEAAEAETGANRRLRGLPFGRHLHGGIPAQERRTPVPVQHLDSDLQEQVGTGFGPPHLLLFHKPFADHLADGRFRGPGRNEVFLPVALTVVWDKRAMVGDARLKNANRLQQFPVLGAGVLNVQRVGQLIDNLQRPIDLPCHKFHLRCSNISSRSSLSSGWSSAQTP